MTCVKWESTNNLGKLKVLLQAEGIIRNPASPLNHTLYLLLGSAIRTGEKEKITTKKQIGNDQS